MSKLRHMLKRMRDDRYRGTSLPRAVRKLCRMAEREADRAHPERLRKQAILALVDDGKREISPDFRRGLLRQAKEPTWFGCSELVKAAQSTLEVDIARSLPNSAAFDPVDAVAMTLHHRGVAYFREQKCQLVADRHSEATMISSRVKHAFDDAASDAAAHIVSGEPAPRATYQVRLDENLIISPSSGAAP